MHFLFVNLQESFAVFGSSHGSNPVMLAASQSSKIFYFEVSSNDCSTASEIVATVQSPTTVACKNMNEFLMS